MLMKVVAALARLIAVVAPASAVHEGFETRQAHTALDLGQPPRCQALDLGLDGGNMRWRRTATAADDIDEPVLGPRLHLAGHVVGSLVVLAHGIGQAGIGI